MECELKSNQECSNLLYDFELIKSHTHPHGQKGYRRRLDTNLPFLKVNRIKHIYIYIYYVIYNIIDYIL